MDIICTANVPDIQSKPIGLFIAYKIDAKRFGDYDWQI